MTVLFVTHQPEDARRIADHIVFLDEGHVAAAGDTQPILRRGLVRKRSGAMSASGAGQRRSRDIARKRT